MHHLLVQDNNIFPKKKKSIIPYHSGDFAHEARSSLYLHEPFFYITYLGIKHSMVIGQKAVFNRLIFFLLLPSRFLLAILVKVYHIFVMLVGVGRQRIRYKFNFLSLCILLCRFCLTSHQSRLFVSFFYLTGIIAKGKRSININLIILLVK